MKTNHTNFPNPTHIIPTYNIHCKCILPSIFILASLAYNVLFVNGINGQTMPSINVSPSTNKNYIHTIIPQVEVASIPNGARSPSQYMEIIEYFDGLGRPMQSVSVGASPNGKDIVVPIVYDNFGREDKKYLPYETADGTGTYRADALDRQYDFYKKTNGTSSALVHKDNRAYAMTVFEPSPLNRITKQGSPGSDWHPDYGRTVRLWHNTNSLNEVPLWKVTSSGANATQRYYAASTLYRQDVVDENNHKSYEYTDLQGKVVRTSRERREGVMASTTYVYDDFSRLAYVVPDTVKVTSFTETDDVFKRFIYAYRYDERGRIKEKHIPGAGWTYIIYNKLDQPVLTQDADQRSSSKNEWSYIKYDVHGRVVVTGIFRPGSNIYSTIQANVYNNANQWETRNSTGYTNISYPTANCEELTVNFYDSYGFTTEANLAYNNGFSAQGLPTGSKVKVLDENTWLYTTIYYDKKGRVAYTASQQANGKYDKVTTEYDFCNRPIKTTRNHSTEFSLATSTGYDHAGRVKTVKQKMGNDGEVTVAENSYNEIGQLIQTKLHQLAGSTTPVETVDYEYNIRGWLTWIKSENYKQKLYYQYALLESDLSKNPWNGNVSTIEWNAKGLDNNWHAFECKYDRLDRLESGAYSKSGSQGSKTRSEAGYHNESFVYDIMGNIKSLKRKLRNTEIDNLTYTYTNGHRIAQVSDGSGNSLGFSGTSNYTYDDAGRMTIDSQKGTVVYNHLSLPKSVTKGTDILKYTYDATGRRVKRQFKTETARHYIDGVEYEGSVLKFIATPYGRIRKNASGVWNYDYFLKDHLGNVRVVLDAGPASSSQASSNQIVYMATMEESKSEEENLYFANINNTRANRPYNYPDKNQLNTKVAKVPGKSKGPSIMLKVMAGDTIEISAKAFYNMDNTLPGKGVDIAPVAGSAISAMTNPTGAVLGEAAQLAADLGADASQSVALLQVPKDDHKNDEVKPKAGLNFVAYNETLDIVEANTGVLLVEDKINQVQTLATDKMVIQEAGFLEIFVNNEAQTPVYFDNIMATQTVSRVLEVNAYYPYGGIITALSTVAPGDEYNGYKYNGKELQDKMNLGWLDYGARMMDPAIGRWMVSDPLAEKYYSYSPYNYALNNPIKYIDPDGRSADGFTVDTLGYFTRVNNEGGDKYDVIYRKDTYSPENAKDYDESGKKDGIKVSKKFMESEKRIKHPEKDSEGNTIGEGKVSHRYEVDTDEEASNILDFMGKNTKVEWGNNYMQKEDGSTLNFMQTTHDKGTIIGNYYSQDRYVSKGYKVVRYDHTHPISITPSNADIYSGKATLLNSPKAIFRILYKGNYYPFDPMKKK